MLAQVLSEERLKQAREALECAEDGREEQNRVKVGGKRQVACLFIDGKPLYESLDIIKWLEERPIWTDQK